MKQSLDLRLGQHLTITPQLQQAIRLLQLSTIELQQEIREALETNPLLEEAGDDADNRTETSADGEDAAAETEATAESDSDGETADLDMNDTSLAEGSDTEWEENYDGGAAPTRSSDGER